MAHFPQEEETSSPGREPQYRARGRGRGPPTTASILKCRPPDYPRPPIPAGIQDEIRLKNRLRRRWQVTRDPDLKAKFNRLQRSVTRPLNKWRNDQ
jgi:hypothetical protein